MHLLIAAETVSYSIAFWVWHLANLAPGAINAVPKDVISHHIKSVSVSTILVRHSVIRSSRCPLFVDLLRALATIFSIIDMVFDRS